MKIVVFASALLLVSSFTASSAAAVDSTASVQGNNDAGAGAGEENQLTKKDLSRREEGHHRSRFLAVPRCSQCDQLRQDQKRCIASCNGKKKKKRCKNRCRRAISNQMISDCNLNCVIPVGQNCGKRPLQCKGPRTCAKAIFDPGAKKVCCPGTGKALTDPNGVEYCASQKSGSKCFDPGLCRSNLCNVDGRCGCTDNKNCPSGVCVSNNCKEGLQPKYSPCDDNADCETKACAWRNWQGKKDLICCPSKTVYFSPVAGDEVCGFQPDNKPCFSNFMCRSKFCEKTPPTNVAGRCRPKP